jgi:beta-galactosidase GanA
MDPDGMKRAAHWMLAISGLKPDLPAVPEGVEIYRRVGKGREVFIIENFSRASKGVPLPGAMKDVLTGSIVHSVTLPVYGVAVLSHEK